MRGSVEEVGFFLVFRHGFGIIFLRLGNFNPQPPSEAAFLCPRYLIWAHPNPHRVAPMQEQDPRTNAIALAFVSGGCSIARKLTPEHEAPTLSVAAGGVEITVIVTESGKPETEAQQRWADRWKGPLCWCSGRDQADAIAHALNGGEFG